MKSLYNIEQTPKKRYKLHSPLAPVTVYQSLFHFLALVWHHGVLNNHLYSSPLTLTHSLLHL